MGGFFLIAGIAILYQDRFFVRKAFIIILCVSLIGPGLLGVTLLPFHHWQLYGTTFDDSFEYTNVEAVGESASIKYDARAVPFLTQFRLRTAGSGLLTGQSSATQSREVACYLTNQARSYRTTLLELRGDSRFGNRFFLQYFGYRWTETTAKKLGQIRGIRIEVIKVKLSADGSRVVEKSPMNSAVYIRPCS
jgi:hypothetical protein